MLLSQRRLRKGDRMRLFFDVSSLLEETIFQIYEGKMRIGSILLEENKDLAFADIDTDSDALSFCLRQNRNNENYSKAQTLPESEDLRKRIYDTDDFPISEDEILEKVYKDDWINQEEKEIEEEEIIYTGARDDCGFQGSYRTEVELGDDAVKELYIDFLFLEKTGGTAIKVAAYKKSETSAIEKFTDPQRLIRQPEREEIHTNYLCAKKKFWIRTICRSSSVLLGLLCIFFFAKTAGIILTVASVIALLWNIGCFSCIKDGFEVLRTVKEVSVYDYESVFSYGNEGEKKNEDNH